MKMPRKYFSRLIVLYCAVVMLCSVQVSAENDFTVRVLVDEIVPVKVNSPQRILISNPTIADINVIGAEEVLVIGKRDGETSLLLWEGSNQRTIPIQVMSQNPQKVISEVRSQLSKSKIKGIELKEENGKVLASGDVISKENLDTAKSIFGNYKIINLVRLKEDRPMIEVSVQILEMSSTLSKNLGIDWPTSYTVKGYPWGYAIGNDNPILGPVDESFINSFGLSGWSSALEENILRAKINFSISEGKTRVLSRPRLLTLSGKEANIVVGGEVPIVTTTMNDNTSQENIEYKDYGIIMNILPTVIGEDKVNIRIDTEISDIDSEHSAGVGKPAFTTRNMKTELFLSSDQVVIIGGLIKKKDAETLKRFPFLSKVPILGEFFKNRSNTNPNEDTELVITVSPRVIRSDKDEDKISENDIIESWQEKKVNDELSPSLAKTSPDVFAYSASVQKKVNEGTYYPFAAREANIEGMVKISLHIISNGDLLDAVVRESSGYKVLDNAALDTARTLAPYAPFPAGVNLKELWVDIPIVYRLGTSKK